MRARPWTARAASSVVLLLLLLVGVAGAAGAHARLESSDPAADSVVAVAPRAVTLVFGEAVDGSASTITLVDDQLRPVAVGAVTAVGTSGTTLAVAPLTTLARGTYTVRYRVSGDDTHPVTGSFRFSVGAPRVVRSEGTGAGPDAVGLNDTAGALLGVARAVGFVGLVLGPGLFLTTLVLWPAGAGERRVRRLVWLGVGLLVGSTLAGRLLQGVWATGAPISAIWSSPDVLDSHSRRFDQLTGLRFYLVVAFAVAVAVVLALTATALDDRRPRTERAARAGSRGREGAGREAAGRGAAGLGRPAPRWLVATTAGLALLLLATHALVGHAAAGDLSGLAVAATVAHLLAMMTWLGGLVLAVVSLTSPGRGDDLAVVLPRFSRVAFTCVCVIVATGSYLGWRGTGSVAAVVGTDYGRLLLAKVACVAVLVLLGDLARGWVRRHLPDGDRLAGALDPADIGRLRRGLVLEVSIGAVVLALTAALVVVEPGRQVESGPRPVGTTTSGAGVQAGPHPAEM